MLRTVQTDRAVQEHLQGAQINIAGHMWKHAIVRHARIKEGNIVHHPCIRWLWQQWLQCVSKKTK